MQNCLKKGLINIHVLSGYHLVNRRERGERDRGRNIEKARLAKISE